MLLPAVCLLYITRSSSFAVLKTIADPSQDRSTTNALSSVSGGVAPNAASATPTTGKSTDTRENVDLATSEPQTTTQASDSTPTQPAKAGGIGSASWFSTAIPFIGGKNKTSENNEANSTSTAAAAATANSEQQKPNVETEQPSDRHTSLEDVKAHPPNHLPTVVPTGHSTELAPSDSNPSTEAAAAVGTSSSGNPTDPMHAHQDIPSDPATGGIGRGSGPPSHALAGSKGSIAPELPDHSNAPLKPAAKGGDHGINPDAIPTAGGKKLGEDSFTERKSISVEGGSASGGLPTETSANTARNVGTAAPAVGGAGAEDVSSTSGSGAGLDKESSPSTSSSGHKKKPSLVEKIKDKVHKH